jgi:molybdenum cofactor guanylyltransferase
VTPWKRPLLTLQKMVIKLTVEVTGAILAGGTSRRMGRDKTLLPVGDRALLARVYSVAEEIFPRLIILSSYHSPIEGMRAPIVKDVFPRKGAITGIVSALLYAETPYVFVLASDMPFIKREAIEYIMAAMSGEDVVVPKTAEGYEPLHALYNRSCISPFLSAIERGRMKISDLFPLLSVKAVEGKDIFLSHGVSTFMNVNTEEDLSRARSLIGRD